MLRGSFGSLEGFERIGVKYGLTLFSLAIFMSDLHGTIGSQNPHTFSDIGVSTLKPVVGRPRVSVGDNDYPRIPLT